MRFIAALMSLVVVGIAALVFYGSPSQPQARAEAPQRETQKAKSGGKNKDRKKAGKKGTKRRGGQRRGGRGGPPPPPILTAIDKNNDGVLTKEEIQNAVKALKTLDKNKDGSIAGDELRPSGGGGRRRGGFFGGFFGGSGSNTKLQKPNEVKFKDGIAAIKSMDVYHQLSYRGQEVLIDTFLADLEFVKFTIHEAKSKNPTLYFINTKTHRAHMMFGRAIGLPRLRGENQMKGVLVYRPRLKSPMGNQGLFTFEFEPFDRYTYKEVKFAQETLVKFMPSLKGNIGYYPRGTAVEQYEVDRKLYTAKDSAVKIYLDEDLNAADIAYLPLNPGTGYGRLRLMKLKDRPSPRDVVLYRSLPNEMPRVAGIITAVRQTPLSHVNLRAIQDKVPNAFINNAADDSRIKPLIGKLVYYRVDGQGFQIREASKAEVDKHYAKIRPPKRQYPRRDLSQRRILPLTQLGFKNSTSVGVKAANIATMHTFGFPKGTIPEGYGIPFYFYDEFMKHNGFYEYARTLLKSSEFRATAKTQKKQLKKFRKLIRKGRMPGWMMAELEKLHQSFPVGTSLRCRSSTNNEDLPGFSGAGLYGSYTHKKSEGHLSKSVKQVFASLWNFRAFEEREFYRVDHLTTAMGVLVHVNFKNEKANGVAVTDDILYETKGNYYLNTQVGEDLVTNPNQESIPEEILLDWWKGNKYELRRRSNRIERTEQLLSAGQLEQLRVLLGIIHGRFAKLYGKALETERFAMEIEFKITRKGEVVVKQARPWVYSSKP